MAYRYGDRNQVTLFPESIEQYVKDDDPVRVYDAFIEHLDLEDLGIEINDNAVGNSSYDPVTMLKILVYAYSYGWRSSRKIERALHHNLSFIWIASGLKPDFKTISEFRRNNLSALKNVLKQTVRLALKLKMIDGNVLFVDGSKFRANAGSRYSRSIEKWEKIEKDVTKRIEELLQETESIDKTESESLVAVNKELASKKRLSKKISKLLTDFKNEDKVNGTDPESKVMKGRQGSHSSFNVQASTDESEGLIVSAEATDAKNDYNQLSKQVENAEINLDKKVETVCADAGYSSIEDLVPLIDKGKNVIVPSKKQAAKQPKEEPFSKDKFVYDSQNNTYTCPEGKELYCTTKKEGAYEFYYRMKDKNTCLNCKNYGECTSAKDGKVILRSKHEAKRTELEKNYESKQGQEIYDKRKMRAELQFGHLKRNLGAGQFLLRGINAANAELGILASCFNLSRLITLMGGVRPFVKKLAEIQ